MTTMMASLLTLSPAVEAREPERWLRFLPSVPVVAKPAEAAVVANASPATAAPAASAGTMQDAHGRVDLNRADVETLDAGLAGVGQAKAEAIVAWRTKHGPFRSVDQLDEVPGFGPALVERNRDRIFVK